jgi:glycerol uptake facilitator-like aquaporin
MNDQQVSDEDSEQRAHQAAWLNPTAAIVEQLADLIPAMTLAEQFADLNPTAVLAKQLAEQLADLNPAVTLAKQLADLNPAAVLAEQLAYLNPAVTLAKQLAEQLADLNPAVTLAKQLADLNPAAVLAEQLADVVTLLTESRVTEFLLAVRNYDTATAKATKPQLSREQERLICGYVAYAIVWLLLLRLMVALLGASETDGEITSLAMGMTGLSGHSLAATVRNLVHIAYDRLQPPEH